MEKRSIGNFVSVLVEIQLYMDILCKRSDGSYKEKRWMKNKRNEKKLQEEREKEEGKKRSKKFIEVLYMLQRQILYMFFFCSCCLLTQYHV